MTTKRTQWRTSDVFIALLIIIVLTILSLVTDTVINFKPSELVSNLQQVLIALAAISFLTTRYRLEAFRNVGETFTWKIVLIGSVFCVLLNACFGVVLKTSPVVPPEFASMIRYSLCGKLLHLFYLIGLGPAIEEILCRGFFYAILKNTYNVSWAAVISTLIFVFFHGPANNIVIIGILSLICVFVYEKTDSILAAICVHCVYNASWLFFTYLALTP